jgi:CDP-4-dehydro-6-deoxyglucose reductase
MPFTITIKPGNHVCTAREGESILEAALREGLALPYGCRNGACGICKGRILEGSVDYGVYQEGALGDAEKRAGLALFCRATPLSDITIECREARAARDIQLRTLPARVHKMEKAAPDVMVLYLKLPPYERLQFLPGQYIDILLPGGLRRSFSLANAPHDDEFLQLHIRLVPGGLFSHYVFNVLREKTILRFEGPHGDFFLREDSDKPIIFVAGGTGFAPVKSMLEHAFHVGIDRQMVLYWGARRLRDLYMPNLPSEWQQRHENFTFIPVLSEPGPEDAWPGRTGLVPQAILDDFADLGGYQVYASGTPAMVEAAHAAFAARGLPESEFFSDAFTFSAPQQPSSGLGA